MSESEVQLVMDTFVGETLVLKGDALVPIFDLWWSNFGMGGNRWKVIVAREEEVHGRVISVVNFLCVAARDYGRANGVFCSVSTRLFEK